MAMKVAALCIISLLANAILFSRSLAAPLNTDSICEKTLHVDFCKYILPSDKLHTIFDYAKISIQQSMLNARSVLDSVNHFLTTSTSLGTVRALEDCQFLADQNVDFLSQISEGINSNKDTINSFVADDLNAFLSAALTNLETCFQGLEAIPSASSIKDRLFQSNGTKMFSVSLALFRQWEDHHNVSTRSSRKSLVSHNLIDESKSPLAVLLSRNKQAVYEFATGKRDIKTLTDGKIGVTQVVMVSPHGDGQFKTIKDAIAAAPSNTGGSDQYFVIYVVTGIYKEYISIPSNKQNLILIGDNGAHPTIITGSRSVGFGTTTFKTATFSVVGKKFIAVDIRFCNTAGPSKHQAVAVRNGADMSAFYRCYFEGYQDTLYIHSFRQFYKDCEIYGTVDFIFGNAAAVFQGCGIHPRLPMPGQHIFITAQGRSDPSQKTGISIDNCSIKPDPEFVSSHGMAKIYLGRPWGEYSRTVYMRSRLDGLVAAEGWREWVGDRGLSTLYYGEYENYGEGANTESRVNWPGYHKHMNEGEAKSFTVSNFIGGGTWLPATGVPFQGGFSY